MFRNDWLRGVKRTPQDFDDLVLRIMKAEPGRSFTVRELSDRMAQFNGRMRPDVNRVLRSMKRLQARNQIGLVHLRRGWFNWYEGRVKNG